MLTTEQKTLRRRIVRLRITIAVVVLILLAGAVVLGPDVAVELIAGGVALGLLLLGMKALRDRR